MKLILVIACVLFTTSVSSQQTTADSMTVEKDYMKLSRSQKTAGFILLGVGAACIAIAAPGNVTFDEAAVLVIVGAVATLGSIPLFIASGKNKRKAKAASVFFKIEKIN